MTDMELADILANCSFHTDAGSPAIYRKVPEVIAGRIIAALRRGPEQDDKEIGEFQQRVYELCEKFYPEVDGAGSDTGDWRDFTFAEIRQTLNHLAERPPSGEMVTVLKSFALNRCYACGWHLSGSRQLGCVPFDCSYRPPEESPDHDAWLKRAHEMESIRAMLSAAEAEVRKPYAHGMGACPLCGRADPHSHTSGPLGMS